MEYKAILIDSDSVVSGQIATVFKRLDNFTLVSSYREVTSALGQGTIFQPNLFILDVENAENRRAIPAFEDIFPGVPIIGTMNQWNADYAMESVLSGALGCMLKPFGGDELVEAIRIFSRGVKGTKPRTCSFYSSKGRSGKTTLIVNLAQSIAKQTGDLVAIIDADLQFSDMALFFDIEPTTSIVEATRDIKFLSPIRLNPYFLPVADNIQLLCGPNRLEYSELVDVESLTEVVRMAQSLFHYVLIDLPSGLSPFSTGMCELADITFMVGMINTGFEVQHMKNSMGMFQMWEQYGKKIDIVFSRVNPCNEAQKKKIETELGHKLTAILPNEYLMVSAANSGKMGQSLPPESLLSKNIDFIADKIIKEKV